MCVQRRCFNLSRGDLHQNIQCTSYYMYIIIFPSPSDYKEYHTDTTVKFVVTLTAEKMQEAEAVGFHKKFKLESSLNTSNLVLFDHNGCLKKYSGATEILKEFYDVRLDLYRKRKEWMVGQLEAEAAKLTNQARFIMEKIEGKVVIGKSGHVINVGGALWMRNNEAVAVVQILSCCLEN